MVNKTYILSGLALLALLNNNKNKAQVSRSEEKKTEIVADVQPIGKSEITVETLKNPERVYLNGMRKSLSAIGLERLKAEVIDDTKQPKWYPTYFECSQQKSIDRIEEEADDPELIQLVELLRNNEISLANDQKLIIIKIEPGMMITWDNKNASHFVAARPNAWRTMIGPCDENLEAAGAKGFRPSSNAAIESLTSIPEDPEEIASLPIRKSCGNTPNHYDLKISDSGRKHGISNIQEKHTLIQNDLIPEFGLFHLKAHSSAPPDFNSPEDSRNKISNVCYTDVSPDPSYFGLIFNDTSFNCVISYPLDPNEIHKINNEIHKIERWGKVSFSNDSSKLSAMFMTPNLMIDSLDNLVVDPILQPGSGQTIQTKYIDDDCNIYDKLKDHINRIIINLESPQD